MVLTEEERTAKAREEKGTLARKKLEKEQILKEMEQDRNRYNAIHVNPAAAAAAAKPKLFVRLRYELEQGKGRRPIELEGTPEELSLFHLFQAIEDALQVPVARQILRPADESTWPLQPKDELLPPFNTFASVDAFPSLESLGVRNGQELFLTMAAMDADFRSTSAASASKPAAVAKPAADLSRPTSAPKAQAAAPASSSSAVGSGTSAARNVRDSIPEIQAHRIKHVWRSIEEKKLALHRAIEERENAVVRKVREDPGTERLAGLLLWSNKETAYYSKLRAELDAIVGLEPVKEWIVQRLRDAAGRHILKEGKQPHRHVLISGHFGVGKRFAAELIGRLFGLLTGNISGGRIVRGARVRLAAQSDPENRGALLSRGDLGIVAEELPPGNPARIRVQGPSGRFGNYREEELIADREVLMTLQSLSELQDSKTQDVRVAEGMAYYLKLGAGATLSSSDGAILDAVLAKGSIVVMTGSQAAVETNTQISSFRRHQPDQLDLPTLGPTELAKMIAVAVEKKGYIGVGEGDVGTPQIIIVLESIVRQRFDEALIREKNGHLAKDILDLAITRKNDRTWMEPPDSGERFRLTPSDFGLDVLTVEQREKRMQEVEQQIMSLVGWGSPDEADSPRHLFASLRQQLGDRTGYIGAKGGATMPKALWVTANAGAGVDTFVQLAARFLRAGGVMTKEEVIWANGADLANAGEGGILAQLTAANRGCWAIRNADALAESKDALRSFISALESAEASTTLIVLVGAPSGMSRLGRTEPALEARFTKQVYLPDFSAEELVQVMETTASNMPSGALSLQDGIKERLVLHINETYGGGSGGKELGERGNLALARQLLQRAAQNRITRLFNKIQEGDGPDDSADADSLMAADFEIGAPLGEGHEQRAAIDQEVDDLIGMGKAKDWFQQMRQKVAFVEKTGTRSDLRVCMNIIITGNPGTGKTTFARLLAKFFHTYGVLSKDSFVEKNGLELKAEYMGGTAPRVKAAVQEALGGCLFLDEAYALIDSGTGVGSHGDVFSQEAMRTLLTEVENNRTNLMVVLGGYKDKMNKMMRADEGLARRFPSRLDLDDYSPEELARISEMHARKSHQRDFQPGLVPKLQKHIENFYWRDIATQNAGLAVNLTEKALDRQIVRMVTTYPEAFAAPVQRSVGGSQSEGSPIFKRTRSNVDISVIKEEAAIFTAADFGIEERPTLGDPEMKIDVQAQVDGLIGMDNVKAFFKEMELSVRFVEQGGDPKVLQTSLNLQLTGNPGTGKTTVARLIAKYLHAHGVLPRDAFVERNALMLKGQFVGQTAPSVLEAVKDAMGGCLFIDEAYALVDRGGDKFSGEVVRTLLTEVENHRTGLLVVLAGYKDKMTHLMDSDPGLRRRFSLELMLEDYSADDLALICEKTARERLNLTFAPGLRESLGKHIAAAHGHEIKQHNGGLAVTLAERAYRRLAGRLGAADTDIFGTGGEASVLLPQDFLITASGSDASVAGFSPQPASLDRQKRAGDTADPGVQSQLAAQSKRLKSEWREVVGSLARDFAEQLLLQGGGLDDCMEGSVPPTKEDRMKAVAEQLAKAKELKSAAKDEQ